MNSKQLNFYSHPNELKIHLEFILSQEAYISVEPFSGDHFEKIESADALSISDEIYKILILNKDESPENIRSNFIATQGYSLFDPVESNIILFTYPRIRQGNQLYRARFYLVTRYLDQGKTVEKDKGFIKWADGLMARFKKKFLLDKEPITHEYCTELVKKMIDEKQIELKQV